MPPVPVNKPPRWLTLALLLLGLLGFADATFLTIKRYTGGALPCSILKGCDVVTSSIYSSVAGVPVSLLGAIFYLLVILLTIFYWQTARPRALKALWALSLLAFLASLTFIYIQGWVLHAWCLYCLVSAATSTLVFLSASLSWRRASTTSVAA